MKVVIYWTDGKTTTLSGIKELNEPTKGSPTFLVQGRTGQTFVNPQAVTRVDVIADTEEA